MMSFSIKRLQCATLDRYTDGLKSNRFLEREKKTRFHEKISHAAFEMSASNDDGIVFFFFCSTRNGIGCLERSPDTMIYVNGAKYQKK